jgi:hypothetical protein
MKSLALYQIVTFLYRRRPREGTIIEYNKGGSNHQYLVDTAWGEFWVKRKNIIESEGMYNECIRRRAFWGQVNYKPPTEPVSFSITLD